MGNDISHITIDSSSLLETDVTGNIHLSYILNTSAPEEALFKGSAENILSFSLDAVHAENGKYILANHFSRDWGKMLFSVKTASSDLSLKIGESSSDGVFSLFTDENEQLIFEVQNYVPDTAAPGKPQDIRQDIAANQNYAQISWNAPADSDLEGFCLRYGMSADDLGTELFFEENSCKLSGLSEGTWYYQVCSVDRSGNRSVWSDTGSFERRSRWKEIFSDRNR